MNYALAPNGIYWSIQGEGHLRGQQMAFVRLAGCSVGCPQCDTDYSVELKLSAEEIAKGVDEVMPDGLRERWVWITGGEPYDRDLRELLKCFRGHGFSIAVATSGVHRVIEPVDWLSVSPHGGELIQRFGSEIKLVDMLNGMDLAEWVSSNPDDTTDYFIRYVQPLSEKVSDFPMPWGTFREDDKSHHMCREFLKGHPNWSLSRQDHHNWEIP